MQLAIFCDTDTAELPNMQAANICFTSLGLVVLDEIRFPNQTPLNDVLGGSGTYGEFPLSDLAAHTNRLTDYDDSNSWCPIVSFSGL